MEALKGMWASPGRVAVGVERQPVVDELEAMRLDLDLLSPEDGHALVGPMVERLQQRPSLGDELRLPPPPEMAAIELNQALQNVVSTKVDRPVMDGEAAVAELRMRRVLEALVGTAAQIRRMGEVSE